MQKNSPMKTGMALTFGIIAVVVLWLVLYAANYALDAEGTYYTTIKLAVIAVAVGIGVAVGLALRSAWGYKASSKKNATYSFVIFLVLVVLCILVFFYAPLYFLSGDHIIVELLEYVGSTAIVILGALMGMQLYNALS